jgi:hypothetical protein
MLKSFPQHHAPFFPSLLISTILFLTEISFRSFALCPVSCRRNGSNNPLFHCQYFLSIIASSYPFLTSIHHRPPSSPPLSQKQLFTFGCLIQSTVTLDGIIYQNTTLVFYFEILPSLSPKVILYKYISSSKLVFNLTWILFSIVVYIVS